ncbi:vomeronasal type-2 receptor 26-like protein [Corchorus capsularis]|uniref:Vomeronasal type-2 receptor 26-like protein n=1 Tax=Corchorus capsularis TaxID=210143 RepID=A0A1R3IBN5_COCAP|nr:vomeronasal type-2 receptor 26-like protein [Corchorus capsularis]
MARREPPSEVASSSRDSFSPSPRKYPLIGFVESFLRYSFLPHSLSLNKALGAFQSLDFVAISSDFVAKTKP